MEEKQPPPIPDNPDELCITAEDQVAISRVLQKIAPRIDKELMRATGKRVPFSLFTWGKPRGQYVANVARSDAMLVMQETLDRWRRHEPDLGPPHLDGIGEHRQ